MPATESIIKTSNLPLPPNWPSPEIIQQGLAQAGYNPAAGFEDRLDGMGVYLSSLLPQGDRRSEPLQQAIEKGRGNCMTRMASFALLSSQLGVYFLPNLVGVRTKDGSAIHHFHADGYAKEDEEVLFVDSFPGTIAAYKKIQTAPDGAAEEFIVNHPDLLSKHPVIQVTTSFDGQGNFRLGDETAEPFDETVQNVRTIFQGHEGALSYLATIEHINLRLAREEARVFIPRLR